MEKRHNPSFAFMIAMTLVVYPVMGAFYLFSITDVGQALNLYRNTTGSYIAKYSTHISPHGAFIYMLPVIFTWNMFAIVYMQTTICRQGSHGYYYTYPLIPLSFYLVFWINSGLNIAWTFLWDRELLEASCAVYWLNAATAYVCTAFAAYSLNKARELLAGPRDAREYWVAQVLFLNGVGLDAGWNTLAMNSNLAIVLSYGKQYTSLGVDLSATVALTVYGLIIVGYSTADLIVLDKYTRYLLTPYLAVTCATIVSVVTNWGTASDTNRYFAAALVCLVVCILITKVIVLIVRHRSRSLLLSRYKP